MTPNQSQPKPTIQIVITRSIPEGVTNEGIARTFNFAFIGSVREFNEVVSKIESAIQLIEDEKPKQA